MPIPDALLFHEGNRIYANLSNLLWVANPEKLGNSRAQFDALLGATLSEIDEKRYKNPMQPKYLRFWKIRQIPKMVWRLRHTISCAIRSARNSEKAKLAFLAISTSLEEELYALNSRELELDDFIDQCIDLVIPVLLNTMLPTLGALVSGGTRPLEKLFRSPDSETNILLDRFKQGYSENVVAEMGLSLQKIANLLPIDAFEDLNQLASSIEGRSLSSDFMNSWDNFVTKYGNRGPMEMDVASPRYSDSSILAAMQMASVREEYQTDNEPNLGQKPEQGNREDAKQELLAKLTPRKQSQLQKIDQVFAHLSGLRDSPKHTILHMIGIIRKRCLLEGERLVERGKLKAREDIFSLSFAQIGDADCDLIRAVDQNSRFRLVLLNHVHRFPSVIDSRGRILLPTNRKEIGSNVFTGMPASPGIATGKVRKLEKADDSIVEEGDIIVAYLADPGWTPLFLKASAVILEIGGNMQHGVVVAREFGKPCVTSIARVFNMLKEGQLVEVDGTNGLVKVLD